MGGLVIIYSVGVLLQLGGITLALRGLDELGGTLFPGRPLPHQAFWRAAKRRVGLAPKPRLVHLRGAASVETAGSVRALLTKRRPTNDAPPEEWSAYLESRIGNVEDRLSWLMVDMRTADDEINRRLADERNERTMADVTLADRLRAALAGPGGTGLDKTWWGLAATALGTLLQAVVGLIELLR